MRSNLAPGCISRDVKLCQRKPLFPSFLGPLFWDPLFSVFLFFLSPAKGGSLEMQPGAKLQAYLGVIILQPHASTQRFRFRILRRTRSFPGRTSARSLSGRRESIWETPSRGSLWIAVNSRISRGCQTQANPRRYVLQIRTTPIRAFPTKASNVLRGWLCAFSTCQFSSWPASCAGSRKCVCKYFLTSGLVCHNLEQNIRAV